jgi:trehalose 6-phosphate phosphatase
MHPCTILSRLYRVKDGTTRHACRCSNRILQRGKLLTLNAAVENFFRSFASAAHALLMLDYDGTLAPFHVDRYQAVPWPGVRSALNLIQNQKGTRIVVVTGRPADEIPPLLALREPVEIWGLHAFERLHPDGRREQEHLPKDVARKLDELHNALRRNSFGGLLEAKPNAAVMHWRGLSSEQAARIEQQARALFEPAAAEFPEFCLLPFDGGIELRAGRDKSAAVVTLLAECGPDTPAAYLGDDLTDEAAFRAINGRGLGALVRSEWRETDADAWLKPPEELIGFLERWRAAAIPIP